MATTSIITKLLTPVKVGDLQLKHRVSMSAMTRLRNDPDTEAPRALNALYYEQRASDGGLIVSEGSSPSSMGRGYVRAPNFYMDSHIEAWKVVTERVHNKGGFIFAQLMHAGRVSHSSLLPDNHLPVAPSAVKMDGLVHVVGGKVPYETPHALSKDEIKETVKEFAAAAKRAIEAGFDGVELHGGNGYLIQEFFAQKTNLRDDEYGGSVENRCRFALEVIDACCEAIGPRRVSIKLQQGVTFSDVIESQEDSLAQLDFLAPELSNRNLAYVALSSLNYEPYYRFVGLSEPNFKVDVYKHFREKYSGTLMINGGISPAAAEQYVADGTADLVSFGVLYLANANLPDLLRAGKAAELNMGGGNPAVWYSRDPADDEKNYTDWALVQA